VITAASELNEAICSTVPRAAAVSGKDFFLARFLLFFLVGRFTFTTTLLAFRLARVLAFDISPEAIAQRLFKN